MTFLSTLRTGLIATTAGIACLAVAIAAAGFTAYSAFSLAMPSLYASGLTALLFLLFAFGLLLLFNHEDDQARRALATEPPRIGLAKWGVLAGEIAGAFAATVLLGRRRR